MNIFVDLDGTLFDTPQLGIDTALLLKKELNINPETYEIARQEMFTMNNKIYSPEMHARRLAKMIHIKENLLVQRFIEIFNNEDSLKYVYSDSVEFLKECSALGLVVILTYGEAFVQTPRATKSGLRTLVDDVIVTQQSKADTIQEYFQPIEVAKTIALIDDSLDHLDVVKLRFPGSITIHLNRRSPGAASTRHQNAESLNEALKILKKNSLV